MENSYTPPLTKTVLPNERQLEPNYNAIQDVDRMRFFTNFNESLMKKIRQIKFQ